MLIFSESFREGEGKKTHKTGCLPEIPCFKKDPPASKGTRASLGGRNFRWRGGLRSVMGFLAVAPMLLFQSRP